MSAILQILLSNPALLQSILGMLPQLGAAMFPQVPPTQAALAGATMFDDEHVKWVQVALRLLGQPLDADGVYGSDTKAAVSQFQTKHALTVDGWAGHETTKALREALVDAWGSKSPSGQPED